ncbi:reverse transcriptase domain-containing protein [Tanacetum coccineum]
MSSFGVKEGRFLDHMVEREGIQMPVSYVSRPLQGMEICYTPTEKRVQALIHTARSLRAVFRKHKEAEGPVVKKFFGQEEQVEEKPDANEWGIFDLSKGLQENVTPATSACRLYLGRETIEEGSCVGIILVSPKEKMYSYAIRLKIKASNHAMDCEALLAGLAASANQGMKDLHVFIDSLTLVAQVEGNHTDNRTRKKVQRGNYGCNGPIPQVLNHTSPKNLKPKSRSVNRAGNYKARIPQPGSIGRYQNKTIDRRDKQQQERQRNKQSTRGKTKLQPRS